MRYAGFAAFLLCAAWTSVFGQAFPSKPLKLVTPFPMSTVASSATIVVSRMFGSPFVSRTTGTTYGSPPEVAVTGPIDRTPM